MKEAQQASSSVRYQGKACVPTIVGGSVSQKLWSHKSLVKDTSFRASSHLVHPFPSSMKSSYPFFDQCPGRIFFSQYLSTGHPKNMTYINAQEVFHIGCSRLHQNPGSKYTSYAYRNPKSTYLSQRIEQKT